MTVTNLILAVTVVVSLFAFSNRRLLDRLIFNPYVVNARGEWYRFVSSGLVHADVFHLVVNMFVLYGFGSTTELFYDFHFGSKGTFYFLMLYFGGMAMSIVPTYKKRMHQPSYNALGASGAVSSVVFAFILFNPLERICLYGILCLPGILFGVAYLAYCFYMDKKGGGRINHDAHLWGAVYGLVFTVFLKPQLLMEFFQKLIYFRNAI